MAEILNDTFTTGTTQDLDVYSSDYVQQEGSQDLDVDATNDRVQIEAQGGSEDRLYRWTGTGSPTGDQEARADLSTANFSGAYIGTRCSETDNAYWLMHNDNSNYLELFSEKGGSWVSLDTGGTTNASDTDCRLKATGTGTVVLTGGVGGYSDVSYNDSSSQLDSGNPGCGIYVDSTGDACWFDNFIIDDLAASGETVSKTLSDTLVLAENQLRDGVFVR